jgi:hypothetical protein
MTSCVVSILSGRGNAGNQKKGGRVMGSTLEGGQERVVDVDGVHGVA